jgi:hypothetical protein
MCNHNLSNKLISFFILGFNFIPFQSLVNSGIKIITFTATAYMTAIKPKTILTDKA